MEELCVVAAGPDFRTGEDDGVEGNVVLSDELEELDFLVEFFT